MCVCVCVCVCVSVCLSVCACVCVCLYVHACLILISDKPDGNSFKRHITISIIQAVKYAHMPKNMPKWIISIQPQHKMLYTDIRKQIIDIITEYMTEPRDKA